MCEILERAISSCFPDARCILYETTGLPRDVLEIIHIYLRGEDDFETAIIMALLNDSRRDSLVIQLRDALLASSNPYVEKWCSRVIELYRARYGEFGGRCEALDYVLTVVSFVTCNRPSCYFSTHCTCPYPLARNQIRPKK